MDRSSFYLQNGDGTLYESAFTAAFAKSSTKPIEDEARGETIEDDLFAVVSWNQINDFSTFLNDSASVSHPAQRTEQSYISVKYPRELTMDWDNDDSSTISSIKADDTAVDESHSHFAMNVETPWKLVFEFALAQLSHLELEEIGRTSYSYQLLASSAENSVCETAEQRSFRTEQRDRVVKDIVFRHWKASGCRIDEAIQNLRATIQFRIHERVNDLRWATLHSNLQKLPLACVGLLNTFISPSGCDASGRANVKIYPSSVPSTQSSKGCFEVSICAIESALAASECRKADTIIVTIDFRGLLERSFPVLILLHDIFFLLQTHYPRRLHATYLLQAPFFVRVIIYILRFLYPHNSIHCVENEDCYLVHDNCDPSFLTFPDAPVFFLPEIMATVDSRS